MIANLVIASWSGGIDSTAVVLGCLARGHDVRAVTLDFQPRETWAREARARMDIRAALPGHLAARLSVEVDDGRWLHHFRVGDEVPHRNKRILDYLIARHCIPRGARLIAMGEYCGADTWVVRDHVAARDADARHLEAYLLAEYGLEYEMITLRNFGPSRYKYERLRQLARYIDPSLTTVCLRNSFIDCGACYKCIERAAAFEAAALKDSTKYVDNPKGSPLFRAYIEQMRGEDVTVSWATLKE